MLCVALFLVEAAAAGVKMVLLLAYGVGWLRDRRRVTMIAAIVMIAGDGLHYAVSATALLRHLAHPCRPADHLLGIGATASVIGGLLILSRDNRNLKR